MYKVLDCISYNLEWYCSKLKSYRRHRGGTWYRVFPKQFPYMSYWTQETLTNEVIFETEKYGSEQ